MRASLTSLSLPPDAFRTSPRCPSQTSSSAPAAALAPSPLPPAPHHTPQNRRAGTHTSDPPGALTSPGPPPTVGCCTRSSRISQVRAGSSPRPAAPPVTPSDPRRPHSETETAYHQRGILMPYRTVRPSARPALSSRRPLSAVVHPPSENSNQYQQFHIQIDCIAPLMITRLSAGSRLGPNAHAHGLSSHLRFSHMRLWQCYSTVVLSCAACRN
eukprot:COSAG02_NODE_4148_length_5713_cov_57.342180_2_plen_214_part_00